MALVFLAGYIFYIFCGHFTTRILFEANDSGQVAHFGWPPCYCLPVFVQGASPNCGAFKFRSRRGLSTVLCTIQHFFRRFPEVERILPNWCSNCKRVGQGIVRHKDVFGHICAPPETFSTAQSLRRVSTCLELQCDAGLKIRNLFRFP